MERAQSGLPGMVEDLRRAKQSGQLLPAGVRGSAVSLSPKQAQVVSAKILEHNFCLRQEQKVLIQTG